MALVVEVADGSELLGTITATPDGVAVEGPGRSRILAALSGWAYTRASPGSGLPASWSRMGARERYGVVADLPPAVRGLRFRRIP